MFGVRVDVEFLLNLQLYQASIPEGGEGKRQFQLVTVLCTSAPCALNGLEALTSHTGLTPGSDGGATIAVSAEAGYASGADLAVLSSCC